MKILKVDDADDVGDAADVAVEDAVDDAVKDANNQGWHANGTQSA